jgi:MinD superfamily P-loop ATPase
MPEIVILSGKGGTGKTSIAGAFAHLAEGKVVCDLDVDAPDLHLLLGPVHEREEEFFSGHEAVIDPNRCSGCGECLSLCRYGAVREKDGGFAIDPLHCEGCKVCVALCPAQAIDFPERHCGRWYVSKTRFGPMVHAQLFPGSENSGRLVALLKTKARELARERGLGLILCDGSPGIGCPVISSLSGADLAVAVTEPTPSGLHDLKRVADLCSHFRIPLTCIINKSDINPAQSRAIEAYLEEGGTIWRPPCPSTRS